MNEILHANVFFVIASIATVLFTVIVCLVLYQVFKLVTSLRRIIERIEAGSAQVAEDVAHARSLLYNGGMIARVIGFMSGKKTSARRSRSTSEE